MSRHRTACVRCAQYAALFITCIGLMIEASCAQEEPDETRQDTRDKLILLNTGRMLTGQVSRNGGGYLIEQPSGRIQVASEDVKFIVKDLHEAYIKQRDSIVEPTPATHIALANWCISHRLHDEARDELKRCLKTDPENAEARRLLQRLSDTIRAGLPPRTEEPSPWKKADGFLAQEAESLGGLSPETAALFTSRIQPLLLNKCGNASCHGQPTSDKVHMTLSRGAGKGSRQNTERNLAEALRYIDLDEVANSQLLIATQGAHGRKGTIFVGPAGAEQRKQLRSWAFAVVSEKQAEAQKLAHRPRVTGKGASHNRVALAGATEERGSRTVTHAIHQQSIHQDSNDEPELLTPAETSAKPRELKVDSTDATALAREPEDPFDPDQFNRRFHRP